VGEHHLVDGRAQALTLPSRTQVLAHRMLRTVPMTCVLCGRRHDINLDLPRDGQPVSLVCSDHEPASGHPSTPQREGEG
jgi:hypothetical protein